MTEWLNLKRDERISYNQQYADHIWKEQQQSILHSIDRTATHYMWTLPDVDTMHRHNQVDIQLQSKDSVTALLDEAASNKGTDGKLPRICVLNFASFKSPGGAFMEGKVAQEECLCISSTLYPVLRYFSTTYYSVNAAKLNKGLYYDTALYSEDILFKPDGEKVHADVLTCAAPNWAVGQRFGGFTWEQNTEAFKSRCNLIFRVAGMMNVDVFILGAWGCGVFKQPASFVAGCLIETAQELRMIPKVIFAVPRDIGRNADFNFLAFQRALRCATS